MSGDRRLAWGVFALVWFSCAWFGSWEWNPNNSTRLFAAISLVEQGDATIDEFAALTIDKAQFAGHAYLDKAPGMTLMALPAVALANRVTGDSAAPHPKYFGEPGLTRYLRLRLRLAAATGPALLTAIAAALLFDLALALTGSRGAALFAALGYALGTPIWGWSTTIFGHAAVAALYVIATWAVWRSGVRRSLFYPALAGVALGWSIVVEYQAVLAGSAIGLWALARWWPRWRSLLAFAVAGAVMALPLLAYNLVAYGTIFHLGYQDVVGWEGMKQGLFGLTTPSPSTLWEITFGVRRGLFWVAPVLAMAPIGLVLLTEKPATRGLGWAAIGVVAIQLLVNAAYVYWDGGNSTGPRIAMPMAGLFALGLAPFWARLETAVGRGVAAAVLGVSMLANMMVAAAEIAAPPEYRFPVWSAVYQLRFRAGDLRTVPSEWWDWSTWHGFLTWAVVAVPLTAWLVRRAGASCPPVVRASFAPTGDAP